MWPTSQKVWAPLVKKQATFWGCEEILPEVPPNLPEKYFKISNLQKKALLVNLGAMWSPKQAFHINSGAIIFKSKHVGRNLCSDFQGVLEGSQRFCVDFRGYCPILWDFAQIFTKSKLVRLYPLHPRYFRTKPFLTFQRLFLIIFTTKSYLRSETYVTQHTNFMHCTPKKGIF